MAELYQDKDWLWEHYITREESIRAVAKEAECCGATICNWLHKYGIPTRSIGEGIFLAERNSVIISPALLEFLEGEILGDGCVKMNGNRSALYQHSSKYREYLIWLSKCFNELGIEQVGQINDWKDKNTGKSYYKYNSRSYPELVDIRKSWYSKRDGKMKKTVPKDLKLTPIMARQWYLGDGGFDNYKSKHPGIILSTCDFDYPSIKHLLKELNRLSFEVTHQPSSNKIRISVRSVPDFLEWIGPCPVSCYDYRWGYSDRGRHDGQ